MKAKLLIMALFFLPFSNVGQARTNKNVNLQVFGIFEPNIGYRDFDATNLNLTSFTGLLLEDGKFCLKPVLISFKEGIDECTGSPITTTLVPDSDNCRFLFFRFSGYNTGQIEAIDCGGDEGIAMMPGKNFTFSYGGADYTFEADGDFNEATYNVENYTLSFGRADRKNRQILVSQDLVEGTNLRLLFIGDLDGDGEPDVILDAANNYENRWIMLFLSSTKEKNELLHLEAETLDWFDC